ncbi:MAG: penicillin-binding transpeptidase domain-containing protein [bacterium]
MLHGRRYFYVKSRRSGRQPTRRSQAKALTALLCVLLGALFLSLLSRKCQDPPRYPIRTGDLDGLRPTPQAATAALAPIDDILLQAMVGLDGTSCLEIPSRLDATYAVQTTLDERFQQLAETRLASSMAMGGVVMALEPLSGRTLALTTYNEDPSQPLAFFWKAYPAASIFKIVTASAALEMGLLGPDSILTYNGGPYILCKRNLSDKTYSWSNRVTLSEAFARSLNPVFGKIGIYVLGRESLERFGSAFFFNQAPACEVPFETARLSVPGDTFGIAEIASGFNRTTVLAPVQAAWIGAAILSGGAAPAPWLVETVREGAGEPIYAHEDEVPVRFTSPAVASRMKELMEDTIHRGTCRRSFAPAGRYRHLRSVCFGGKTGNINDDTDSMKFDWFVGYGEEKPEGRSVVLCVLMLHGPRLGHRANRVAFDLFNQYFRSE